MNWLIFILTGFLLFFLFRLLLRISKVVFRKKILRKGSMALLPLLELVLWIAYAFWGVYILFGGHLYYDLIIVVMMVLLVVAVAWFLFRDLLAGVLLKAEKSLEPGQMIKTSFVEGKIKSLGSRSLELVNDAGETVRIPYVRFSNELLIIPPENEDSLPHHLEIPLATGQSPEKVRALVNKHLLAMPWIIDPAPEVKIVKAADARYFIRVTFHTHIGSQAVMVEEKIKEVAGNQ